MKHLFTGLAFCLATIAGFAQCEADHTVEASSFIYAPTTLTIEQGESVAFVNTQGFHDVNGVTNTLTGESFNNPADFSLGSIAGNADGVCMGTVTFDVPGTYNYDCSIGNHAEQGMVGSITVNALPTNTVVDVIVNSPDHELLEAAVLAADLAGALSADGPFTVFAPTDDAIGALVAALGITAEELLALETLGDILTYHVVAGEALSTSLTDGQMIATLLGPDVTVTITDDGTFINDALVTFADIPADNGVVHVIDAVLSPPVVVTNTVVDVIVNSPDHELLEAAVLAADLAGALSADGPFTVFAPTDDAIGALVAALGITAEELLALETLGDILTYHVVAGEALSTSLTDGQMIATLLGPDVTVTITDDGTFINDALVTFADIPADNGVVHVIDAVLLPPAPVPTTIWDIVEGSEDHNYLEAALLQQGLDGALNDTTVLTLFAPTDAAFEAAAVAYGTDVDGLLALPYLTDILLYHVTGGAVMSTDLSDGQVVTMLNEGTTTVTIDMGVFINNAQVTDPDLTADNGVVHVLDALIQPATDGIQEAQISWTVMPNPASDEVRFAGLAAEATAVVLDLTGRQVAQLAAGNNILAVGHMAPGTYLVAVTANGTITTSKLVVR